MPATKLPTTCSVRIGKSKPLTKPTTIARSMGRVGRNFRTTLLHDANANKVSTGTARVVPVETLFGERAKPTYLEQVRARKNGKDKLRKILSFIRKRRSQGPRAVRSNPTPKPVIRRMMVIFLKMVTGRKRQEQLLLKARPELRICRKVRGAPQMACVPENSHLPAVSVRENRKRKRKALECELDYNQEPQEADRRNVRARLIGWLSVRALDNLRKPTDVEEDGTTPADASFRRAFARMTLGPAARLSTRAFVMPSRPPNVEEDGTTPADASFRRAFAAMSINSR